MTRTLLVLLPLALFLALGGFALATLPIPAASVVVEHLLPAPSPAKILFVGDVMLDRHVAKHAAAKGDAALFAGVRELFGQQDAIIANLEGTLTSNESVAVGDVLRFTFHPRFAALLASLGVRAVSLSNNHTDDFGSEGLVETRERLAGAGIAFFGSPHNTDSLSTTIEVAGKHVCLVGYEGFIAIDPEPVAAEIARLRPTCDYLVATMHAGEEYEPDASPLQERAARAFVDAGADVVIGTHPHVVQPLELYRGKPIFYSLGNFMFDQNFSFGTTHGLAVELTLAGERATYRLIPITVLHQEVSLSDAESAAKTLASLGVESDTFEVAR